MIFLKAKRSILLLALCGNPGLSLAGEASLRQDLLRLEDKLSTAQVSDSQVAPGVQAQQANALFLRAEASFRAKEYLDAVRTLNQVLNASPKTDHYLESQYYLGRSYEELHYPARSIKAYLRFLSSFASRNDYTNPRLLEVINRLLIQKEDMLAAEGENFDRLLANLISLTGIPAAKRDEIKLLAAKSAYHGNKMALAEEWLNDLLKKDSSPNTQANAQFYLGQTQNRILRQERRALPQTCREQEQRALSRPTTRTPQPRTSLRGSQFAAACVDLVSKGPRPWREPKTGPL
jgi:tetratricopeptide (TPR) repeat protein